MIPAGGASKIKGIPRMTRLFIAICVVMGMVLPAAAQDENVLRWASRGDALTFDPHGQNETPTITALTQVYETLVSRDAALTLMPRLATSWEITEPTVWEFQLREGVTFHDGTPFTAEDVAFSLTRAQGDSSDFRSLINTIESVEVVSDHVVRVHTSVPTPLLVANLTDVFIMSAAWSSTHNVEEAQDFAAGEENYAVRHANGTGPFTLELREPDIRSVFTRFDGWWGLEVFEPHNVDRIIYTPITNDATRVAAILSGEVDFVLDPPLQDLRRLESAPGLQVQQTAQVRTIFFGLDQASDELRSSNIRGANPFADRRVRLAMYQAIDIDAIQSRIMRGLSQPAGVIISPPINGHTAALDTRPGFDPDAARQLMADAGYADGFSVTLDCPNNRYVNDEAICQATVAMLARIGIEVTLDAQPKSLHFPKIDNRETDFYMQGWGVPTLDSEYVFQFLYYTGRRNNGTGYSNARLDELTDLMAQELDEARRNEMIAEAWAIATEDIVFLPLHHQVIVWAVSDEFDQPIVANNTPQFYMGRFTD